MKAVFDGEFNNADATMRNRLRLHGLRPKTVAADAQAIRHLRSYFGAAIDDLSEAQLTDHFASVLQAHSWSTLKHRLYGLRFYSAKVLHKPCPASQNRRFAEKCRIQHTTPAKPHHSERISDA